MCKVLVKGGSLETLNNWKNDHHTDSNIFWLMVLKTASLFIFLTVNDLFVLSNVYRFFSICFWVFFVCF